MLQLRRLDITSLLGGVVMAELVRIFHNVSLAEAQAAVESLVQKRNPTIWEIAGTKRVLDPGMKKEHQTLLLLYSESGWTPAAKLCSWIEYSSLSLYKSRILDPLHKNRMIEYDGGNGLAQISPLGITVTERDLLPIFT
jgi:hypothetical protein